MVTKKGVHIILLTIDQLQVNNTTTKPIINENNSLSLYCLYLIRMNNIKIFCPNLDDFAYSGEM